MRCGGALQYRPRNPSYLTTWRVRSRFVWLSVAVVLSCQSSAGGRSTSQRKTRFDCNIYLLVPPDFLISDGHTAIMTDRLAVLVAADLSSQPYLYLIQEQQRSDPQPPELRLPSTREESEVVEPNPAIIELSNQSIEIDSFDFARLLGLDRVRPQISESRVELETARRRKAKPHY